MCKRLDFQTWTPFFNTHQALNYAVLIGPTKVGAVEALLAGGANPAHVSDAGSTVLMHAAQNPDSDAALVRRLLQIPEVALSVDAKFAPRTLKWKAISGGLRLAVRLGSKNSFFLHVAREYRATALHYAAADTCNVKVVRVLTEEGEAEVTARNAQGQTALESANEKYGGRGHTPVEMTSALQ